MIAVLLALELALSNPPANAGIGFADAQAAFRGHGPCAPPADLTPDPSVAYRPGESGVPADLPGPKVRLPQQVPVYLGDRVDLGAALVDTTTGAVTLYGTTFAPPPDCR